MFQITKDPSSGSDDLYFWLKILVMVHKYLSCAWSVFGGVLRRQTPTTHMINICEPLEVISVKSTGHHSLMMDPLWSETCWSNFNYVSFKLLYKTDFNIYISYNWVH